MNQRNGYEWLRLLTPVIATASFFILNFMMMDIKELKSHFTNHLSEHKAIEIKLESRLSRIEQILTK